jgi:hypothetical protein
MDGSDNADALRLEEFCARRCASVSDLTYTDVSGQKASNWLRIEINRARELRKLSRRNTPKG